MRRPNRPQALFVGAFNMPDRHHRIRALQAEHEIDRRVGRNRVGAPHLDGGVQLRRSSDLLHLAPVLHRAIPGKLSLSLSVGLLRRMPARQVARRFHVARNLRRHTNADAPRAHLGKTYSAIAAVLFVGLPRFPFANFIERSRDVAIPLQRVHAEVEMGVENKHPQSLACLSE